MSDMGTAILTYGRGLMTVVAARSLAKRGVRVITCDSVGFTAASFSRYSSENFVHADPDEDPEQYERDFRESIERFRPDDADAPYVLVPMFRDAVWFSENAAKFDDLIALATPPWSAITAVHPKQNLFATADRLSLSAPKTWHPKTPSELEAALSKIKMPAIVKAVDDVGGRGIDFFEERSNFETCARRRIKDETPPPLLQETVQGEDYCVCVLYQDGERLAHMAYTNLQTMPSEGGSGAMRETVDDTVFLEIADKLLGEAKWTGVAEIDFMWTGDPDDPPHLIEVNPRFWAGLFQSVESGIDFPWLTYQLAAFGDLYQGVDEAEIGTKTKVPGLWLAGGLSDAFATKSESPKMRDDPLEWSDFMEDAKGRDFSALWTRLKTAFGDTNQFDQAVARLRLQRRHAREAKSELMLDDDPAISLGVFYVLSSLARHGELPAELKS